MIVAITPDAYSLLRDLARARDMSKKGFNDRSHWFLSRSRVGRISSEFDHLVGLCGEWAVAQYLGVDINREVYTRHGDQGRGDVLFHGKSIQVKTRTRASWDYALSSDSASEFKTNYGALCWPGSDETEASWASGILTEVDALGFAGLLRVDIVGLISEDDFLSRASRVNYGHGWRLVVGAAHFLPIRIAKEMLCQDISITSQTA